MPHGRLIIISGPSGAGKGTLVKKLVSRLPDTWVSVSATTRPPRPGEIEGVHYFFLTPAEFDARVRSGEFLEHAQVHGNCYGTLRGPVERRIAEGLLVILEIDPQGALQVKQAKPDSVLVFIVAPEDELRKRLAHRGSETPDQVETRMRTAERELKVVGNYDYVVKNDDVDRAVDELCGIIASLPGDKDT